MYYKIVKDQEFMGIGSSFDLIYYQPRNNLLLNCAEEQAQYIQNNEQLYHAGWMNKPAPDIDYLLAEVVTITENEYELLKQAVDLNKDIKLEEPTIEQEEVITEDKDLTLEYVLKEKINSLRKKCNKEIIKGVDVKLSDNKIHHFSLDEHDQTNLLGLSFYLAEGANYLPYHADEESCILYSAEDLRQIIDESRKHIIYHTTYYNSLKNYVNSLQSIEEILAVEYGIEIPVEYQSEALKELYKEKTQL